MPATSPAAGYRDYTREWYRMMTRIWSDRIALLGAMRTGALRTSVRGAGLTFPGSYSLTATYHFLTYGLYVDAGTGNGYKHDNGGNLHFLDPAYRAAHHLGKPRKARPWFTKSWYVSREVLKDKLLTLMGEAYFATFADLTR
ncbi:MAG: hypothetical protein Q4P78_08595 [Rothia sp. (in: high G+C Gram-positive bacteria)]|uniref:hypothetical protein n=1 Tax=Rothia sp. (in: high G+C Gram-positive bacteria) TaxID=1885016 RepID=UPI0026E09662|nr:hypothetical protein [Rothia sp. (in: high G+C Gram-positive bacteria)]MDO5751232.1 hypothetical protein [Rothia sp. (in: high G+C Gram-positive bacteria)]